jgi:hypothetical protein
MAFVFQHLTQAAILAIVVGFYIAPLIRRGHDG